MVEPTEHDKIEMALDRLALFEQQAALKAPSKETLAEFIANMRLRLEHGSPGDTIACFARAR
jgi:hypothetical protein